MANPNPDLTLALTLTPTQSLTQTLTLTLTRCGLATSYSVEPGAAGRCGDSGGAPFHAPGNPSPMTLALVR